MFILLFLLLDISRRVLLYVSFYNLIKVVRNIKFFDDEDDDVDNNGNWGNVFIFDFKSGIIIVVFDVDLYLVCFIILCNNMKFVLVEFI